MRRGFVCVCHLKILSSCSHWFILHIQSDMKKKSTHSEHLTRTRRQHWSKQTKVCNNCWILKQLQNGQTVLTRDFRTISQISLPKKWAAFEPHTTMQVRPQVIKFAHRHTKSAVVCHSYDAVFSSSAVLCKYCSAVSCRMVLKHGTICKLHSSYHYLIAGSTLPIWFVIFG